MTDIPVTDGMIELLKYCQDQNYETIIISDSNSVFIDMILENAQLTKMVTKVFTNPAYFNVRDGHRSFVPSPTYNIKSNWFPSCLRF
jgi:2-hydroxy-3-keto-5-methylthiopentenyl-1-phosphate phosphatase